MYSNNKEKCSLLLEYNAFFIFMILKLFVLIDHANLGQNKKNKNELV